MSHLSGIRSFPRKYKPKAQNRHGYRNRISHKAQNTKSVAALDTGAGDPPAQNGPHFTGSNANTKFIRVVTNAARRARLDYEGFRRLCAVVRKELGLRRP